VGFRRVTAGALVALGVIGSAVAARADESATVEVPILAPPLGSLQIWDDTAGLIAMTVDGTGEALFDAGAVESAVAATLLRISADDTWELSVSREAAWTAPAGYAKDGDDVQVRITTAPAGTIQNGADSYLSPGTSGTVILSDGQPVDNNRVEVQTRVLLDWAKDVPGDYSMTLTYTLAVYLP
jgi:hypothetical protein